MINCRQTSLRSEDEQVPATNPPLNWDPYLQGANGVPVYITLQIGDVQLNLGT